MGIKRSFKTIKQLTNIDLKNKSIFELLASTAEEFGELSRELKIENKTFGNDHKVGDEGSKIEAVDLLICAAAIYFGVGGSIQELPDILDKKLLKWANAQKAAKDIK